MAKRKVYAIIISYNGEAEVLGTVKSICSQVDKVVVVDNASGAATLIVLNELEIARDIHLIRLDDNLGIAYAQNVGVDFAQKEGADWVLTLDQDSSCAKNMVDKLIDVAERYGKEKVGFCCPVINYQAPAQEFSRVPGVECIDYAISSGCLFPMSTLQSVGRQRDDYFIDSVDFEYCLRLAAKGYRMLRVNDAVLNHRLGLRRQVDFLGIVFSISVHAPFRRYYSVRNHIFLVKMYWRYAPTFLIKKTFFLLLLFLQILLLENKKMENIRQCGRGVADGFRGRGGKNTIVTHG